MTLHQGKIILDGLIKISLNMMICGLRNAGFKFNRHNAKTFDIMGDLSDWLPVYDAQGIANDFISVRSDGIAVE